MGVCESGKNTEETNISKGVPQPKPQIIEENILKGNEPIKLNVIKQVSKSLCFIETPSTSGSGFLIKLFKGTQDFFCLITCEHVIKREMVNQRKTIRFFYDCLNTKLK